MAGPCANGAKGANGKDYYTHTRRQGTILVTILLLNRTLSLRFFTPRIISHTHVCQ